MPPATNIPYPNVPAVPGVPQLLRQVGAVAPIPVVTIGIGALENILGAALQQAPQWGIFDAAGNQVGISPNSSATLLAAIGNAALSLLSGASAVLSTFGFDYMKEMVVSDFPVEGGSFASYNKVEKPGNPVVTLALAGSVSDRTTFLNAIDAATKSINAYSVVTPEITYSNYTLERYRYQRRAERGATLLMVEVSLKQVRGVVAAFTTVTVTPIVNPQDPGATSQVSNGPTQPIAPPTSTFKSLANKLGLH
jgi:hypothetical protein